jgi:hypothetical protein
MLVGIRHAIPIGILARFLQIGDASKRLGSAVSWPQMADLPTLGRVLIGIVTAGRAILLNIAEDRFIPIVVRASIGRADPWQPRLRRFCRIFLALLGCAGLRRYKSDVTFATRSLV